MVYRTPDGQEFGFHGEFREIVRPERIVRTFVFEAFPDQEALETMTLAEKDGRTTITTLTVHKTVEGRDGHLAHGMEAGMTDGYALLDELLAAMVGGGAAAGPAMSTSERSGGAVGKAPELVLTGVLRRPPARLPGVTRAEHVSLVRTQAAYDAELRSDFRPAASSASSCAHRTEYPFEGAFRQIVASERIVFTGAVHEGNATVTTITFTENDSKTTLTMHQTFTFESGATRGAKPWLPAREQQA